MYHTNYYHGWNCGCNEAPYASKAQGNTAVTLASVLGGIGTLGALNNGGLGGLFGGLFGGNNGMANAVLAQKDAEIAELKAERYSDNAAETQANRLLVNYLKPYGDAIAESKANEARMQAEIDCLKKTGELREELLKKEIQLARQEAQCCCEKNANAVNALAATVGAITTVKIASAALPTTTTTAPAA
jgi:hypothetical protein